MHNLKFIDNPQQLAALFEPDPSACTCVLQRCAGWESVSETEWPAQHMSAVATLRDPDVPEPTFEEHHPNGTRYASADAPVALQFFPYNRCDVFACARCQQHVLRYTEFGGYYVDHRARRLHPDTLDTSDNSVASDSQIARQPGGPANTG